MRDGRRIAACLTVLALTAAAGAAAADLKIATLAPEGSFWMNEVRRGAEEIERRTDGRVGFRFYPGGSMGTDQTVLRKMRIGQLHGGALLAGTLAERVPDLEVYSLPLMFRSYAEVDAARERFDDELRKRLDAAGYVSFGFIEGGFAYLMSTKPIRRAEDLRGQKAWIPEGDVLGQAILEAAGLSPVPLPLSDVLTGLQTGLVDAVAGPPVGAVALQWFTRVRHMTELPILYTYGALVVSDRAWGRISESDRAIVREVLEEVTAVLDARARRDNRDAREALVEQGVEPVDFDDQAVAEWEQIAAAATTALLERLEIDRELLEDVREAVAQVSQGGGTGTR